MCWRQLPPKSIIHVFNISSKVWMVISDYPSVWGWYVVLRFSLVPKAFCKFYQNRNTNRGSLSETILISIPCNLTISSIYSWTNFFMEYFIFIGKKWADLVNRSTSTQTASWPLCVRGKFETKFILMRFHFHSGISRGCNKFEDFLCSVLSCLQVRQVWTFWAISFLIFFN